MFYSDIRFVVGTHMLDQIELWYGKWANSSLWPEWIADSDIRHWVLILIAVLMLNLVYKLSRSVEVASNGKVIVKYHSPLTWPARFIDKVASDRANYSPKQRQVLASMYRGKNIMQAFSVLLLGLVLGGMGAFLVFMEPHSIFERYTAGLLIAGILLFVLSRWLYKTRDSGNPYQSGDNE